jgi:hypothetical protein
LRANRVNAHKAPADQHHTAGNIGKVSQYIKSGEAAKLVPATRPARGARRCSPQKRITNRPERKQVVSDRIVMKRQGSPVSCESSQDGG